MINLRDYEKRYKVVKCETETGCYEIIGKRGYVRPYGDVLEMYLTSSILCGRAEKQSGFKAVNHYDDASAFVFGPDNLALACKWIKARNRRVLSPEARQKAVARLARINSLRKKPR